MNALTGASEMVDLDSGGAANDDAIVFVVDDDASVRRSTERLVRPLGFGIQTFASAREFLEGARVERPACLVLDVQMPGLSGLDLQRELAQRGVEIPIVFLTGHGDIPITVQAMKAGAVEFLTKPVKSRDLLIAIRGAIERGRVSHQARREVAALRERYERLTPREREVLPLVVAGLLNKQIAGELAASERTVKFHRAHIMEKMEAESLADLVRIAERLGVGATARRDPVPEDR
jgi:FixJ family two-component response regulator